MPKELVINDWQKGIAESPLVGFGDMRNVDLYSQVGALKVNPKLSLGSNASSAPTSLTLTVNTSTDVWTSSVTHQLTTGTMIEISSSGSLPSPLSSGNLSYVIVTGSNTFKIASTFANAISGSALDITTSGTGTITGAVTIMGRVTGFASDPNSTNVFAQDTNGRIWYSTTATPSNWALLKGNTLTGAAGNGIVVWKGYLLAFRNTQVDATSASFTTLTNTANSWTNNFASFSSPSIVSGTHRVIWGQDDILYFTNGRYIASIQEVAGSTFDPSSSGTFTPNAAALTLPAYITSSRIEELGTNLMVLGSDQTNSYIFPWDRTSPTFNLPMRVPNAISTFVTYNNTLYLFATDTLKIYKTNGSYMVEEEIFPQSWLGTDFTSVSIGAATIFKGRLLFSMSQAGIAQTGPNGIYSYDLKTGALVMENGISTGNYYAGIIISALYSPKQSGMYFAGWQDSSSFGIDCNRTSGPSQAYTYYSNYEPYVETQLYEIGTPQDVRQLQELSLTFSNKLASTQGVRLSYRTNLTDSYTLIGTYDFSTLGAVQTYAGNFSSTGSTHIQFKIELSDAAGTMGLLALKLR